MSFAPMMVSRRVKKYTFLSQNTHFSHPEYTFLRTCQIIVWQVWFLVRNRQTIFFFTEITNFYYNHYLILRFELGRSASTMKILCQINVNGIFKISRSTTLLKEDKNKHFNIYICYIGPSADLI